MMMELHESAEMYLETILVLKNRLGLVRSIDVVNEMDFSKPTISIAMKKFKEEGYVTIDHSGFIDLTEKGRAVAEKIYERHQVLSHILINLGVGEKQAVADACKMEHDISEETFACLKKEYMRLKNRK
jgi:Mn-dependent DtxR family transcriptional regulator